MGKPRIRVLAKGAATPLTIVGYIFTDLEAVPEDRTKVTYKRHPQSFYLSSLETIFAVHVQNANPISSRSSPTRRFASRMVTVVLTGTEDGGIDISASQVSEQACAMGYYFLPSSCLCVGSKSPPPTDGLRHYAPLSASIRPEPPTLAIM